MTVDTLMQAPSEAIQPTSIPRIDANFLMPSVEPVHIDDPYKLVAEQNIGYLTESFCANAVDVGRFEDEEAARSALAERSEELKNGGLFPVIDMTPQALLRFLQVGEHQTYWHHVEESGGSRSKLDQAKTTRVAHFEEYEQWRAEAEGILAEQVPAEYRTTHPNYAYIAATDSQNSHKIQNRSGYGNVSVKLNVGLDDPAAAYTFGDSFYMFHGAENGRQHNTAHILTAEQLPEAVAMLEIANQFNRSKGLIGNGLVKGGTPLISIDGVSGYVEAALFERVTTAKIDEINILIPSRHSDHRAYDNLPEVVEAIEVSGYGSKTVFDVSPNNSFVFDWCTTRFQTAEPAPEDYHFSELWEAIGCDRSSTFATVSQALRLKAEELAKELFRYEQHLSNPPARNSQRDGYLPNLYQSKRLMTTPEKAEKLQTLIDIEEARYFFQ